MKDAIRRAARAAMERPDVAFAILIGGLYLVGILSHIWPATRGLMVASTPWFLFATGAAALLLALPRDRRSAFIAWALLSYLVTFALEAIGVATGKVFGAYEYGPALGAHVLGVPPVIGFNWVMIILAFAGAFTRMPGGRIYGPVLAAAAATAFDWVMEPAALGLGYWAWEGGAIPMRNYAAWFLIALASSAAYSALGLKPARRAPLILAAAQLAFFGVLRIALFG